MGREMAVLSITICAVAGMEALSTMAGAVADRDVLSAAVCPVAGVVNPMERVASQGRTGQILML